MIFYIFLFLINIQLVKASDFNGNRSLDKLCSGILVEQIVLENSKYVRLIRDNEKILKNPFDYLTQPYTCTKEIFDVINPPRNPCRKAGEKHVNNIVIDDQKGENIITQKEYYDFKNSDHNDGYWTATMESKNFVYASNINKDSSDKKQSDTSYTEVLKKNVPYFIITSCDPFFFSNIGKSITNLCLAHINQPIQSSILERFINLNTLSLYKCVVAMGGSSFLKLSQSLKELTLIKVQENVKHNAPVLLALDDTIELEKLKIHGSYIKVNNQKPLEKLRKIDICNNDQNSIYSFHQDSFNHLEKILWDERTIQNPILQMIFTALKKTVRHVVITSSSLPKHLTGDHFTGTLKVLHLENQNREIAPIIDSYVFQNLKELHLKNLLITNHKIDNYKKLKNLSLENVLFDKNEKIDLSQLTKLQEFSVSEKSINFIQWNNQEIISCDQTKDLSLNIKQLLHKRIYEIIGEDNHRLDSLFIADVKNAKVVADNTISISTLKATNVKEITCHGNISRIEIDQNTTHLHVKGNQNTQIEIEILGDNNLKTISGKINILNDDLLRNVENLSITVQNGSELNTLVEKLQLCTNLEEVSIDAIKKIETPLSIPIYIERVSIQGPIHVAIGDRCQTLFIKGTRSTFSGGSNIRDLHINDKFEEDKTNLNDLDIKNVKTIFLCYRNIQENNPIILKILNQGNSIECLIITDIPEKEYDSIKQKAEQFFINPRFEIKYSQKTTKENKNAKTNSKIEEMTPNTQKHQTLKRALQLILIAGSILGIYFRKPIWKYIQNSIKINGNGKEEMRPA